MPEVRFKVRWPDETTSVCYSPSSTIKDFLEAGETYELDDFVSRCQVALQLASERVRKKYGYSCSSAMDQLAKIEHTAKGFKDIPNAKVVLEAFIE